MAGRWSRLVWLRTSPVSWCRHTTLAAGLEVTLHSTLTVSPSTALILRSSGLTVTVGPSAGTVISQGLVTEPVAREGQLYTEIDFSLPTTSYLILSC